MSMWVPTRSLLSAVRWHWAVHAGVWLETEPYMLALGLYMPVLGYRGWCWLYTLVLDSKCRCWVVDAGIGLKTEALGHMCWCWVTNAGAGFEMSGLDRLVVHTGVRTHWCWFVDTGIGPCWFSVARVIPMLICGMRGRAYRKDSGGGGWGQAGGSSMVGVVSREW